MVGAATAAAGLLLPMGGGRGLPPVWRRVPGASEGGALLPHVACALRVVARAGSTLPPQVMRCVLPALGALLEGREGGPLASALLCDVAAVSAHLGSVEPLPVVSPRAVLYFFFSCGSRGEGD